MTTPGPPIGLNDVAAELGISSVNLSLSDSRVRALAGIPSGSIGLQDCEHKSAIMSAAIGGNQSGSGTSTSNVFSLTCTPTGGTGPYTYSWAYGSQGGTGTISIGSPSSASTGITLSTSGGLGSAISCNVQCTVHDSAGHMCTSNAAALSWTFV